MAVEVIVPKVDMVMETGTFVEWLKQEGQQVNKGEPLFVLMTDKAAIEVESPASGLLAGLRAKADDVLPVTEVIAYVLAPGESLPVKNSGPDEPKPQPAAAAPEPIQARTEPAAAAMPTSGVDTGKIRATPLARRLAKEGGLGLHEIAGRGPRGRIQKADVLAFQKSLPAASPAPAYDRPSGPSFVPVLFTAGPSAPISLPDARRKQVIPVAGARKIIAERMSYSAYTAPHIHLSLRVDMTETVRFRQRVLEPIQAQTGHRVSYTAIVALAVAKVLPRHPYLNASLSGGEIIQWEDIHLGIATSVDENLIVPVIREAQSQSLGQIVAALANLTERARSRRLTPTEMMGSTFTISNLGMFGIESFTAIINPPEAAILAVGKMIDTAVPLDGQILVRPLMEITACADHRIADGAVVARFLADLQATLENPYLLI